MQSSSPRISIVMPCRNAERYVAETVACLKDQTYDDFEVIALDDGSTDGTRNVLKRMAADWPRLKVVALEPVGLVAALNIGLQMASGEWIARIDSDDLADQDRLRLQIREAERAADTVLVGTSARFCDSTMRVRKVLRYSRSNAGLVRAMRTCRDVFPHSAAMFRRDVVLSIGGYRSRFKRAQDLDLWLRLSERGRLACVRRPLVSIRCHDHQTSRTDGGSLSFLMGRIAVLCAILRSRGYPDPMDAEPPVADRFFAWATRRLNELAEFERRRALREAFRDPLGSGPETHPSRRLAVAIRELVRADGIVWQRLLGSRTPWRLAEEWIRVRNR